MKSKILHFLCIGFLGLSLQAYGQVEIPKLKEHVYYLSSDAMKGRATGSKENKKAARYIEKEFKKMGLTPKGENGFRQPFTAKVTRVIVKDSLRKAENIIGFLDNQAAKTIVIGAHYDHLGLGKDGGSRDSTHIGHIHNGADDNASGVAGLLELARHYTSNGINEPYNILFIAFGAEELGLLGSKHFVEQPTVNLQDIHWMLNFDMIGRYDPANGLAIIGYGTSPGFKPILSGINSSLKYHKSHDGSGGSDQTSFYRKDIPVLFFHTGGHEDYHKKGDTAEKINYQAMQEILQLAIQAVDNSMKQADLPFQATN